LLLDQREKAFRKNQEGGAGHRAGRARGLGERGVVAPAGDVRSKRMRG
jgi:hypothetical protein